MRVRGLEQTSGSGIGSPLTSSRRSTGADFAAYGFSGRFAQLERFGHASGGAEETRTPDFLLAKEALYQLSYGPKAASRFWDAAPAKRELLRALSSGAG
jgi:hypothetical protein